ncbi:3'(2'),5'-bisphosphate nucleotidase CysQ [Candidatus Saccharibacteria bacterium]|nr:3'(2'),5'-bisphosphate nucleotidase CysQ [Candidatus Saccharibacteria bacterium]
MAELTRAQIAEITRIARRAGAAIMDIYNRPGELEVVEKTDLSPLTRADIAAHEIITRDLGRLLPDIPIVSEEGDETANRRLLAAEKFWLVDPLDGTKEFIRKDVGHFAVCMALIEDNSPTFGVIYAPALDEMYYGGKEYGSYEELRGGGAVKLAGDGQPTGAVMVSRSHLRQETKEYIRRHYPDHDPLAVGSQLKFAHIAKGLADVYPRIEPYGCHTWDVAAGHAILEGAGGRMSRPDGAGMDYRNEDTQAGPFIARRP